MVPPKKGARVIENESGESLQGELQKISYQNQENGWSVVRLRLESDDRMITATGQFGRISVGESYQMWGSWVENQKYGRQFKVSRYTASHPASVSGILRYLKSGLIRGIGEVTAKRIVDHFGLRTLHVLDHDPERLMEVENIGTKKKKQIIASWNERKRHRDTEMFLTELGISPNFINRIIQSYGDDTRKVVEEDPYRLARDIDGIGFLSADEIALKMGLAPDSPPRISAAILFQIEQAEEEGHCYQNRLQIAEGLSRLLRLPQPRIDELMEDALDTLIEESSLVFDESILDDGATLDIYYLARTFQAESRVAEKLSDLLRNHLHMGDQMERIDRWLHSYSSMSGASFSDEQLDAVRKAVSNRVFVLTGGPGVGKTTTANAIIRLLIKMNKSVALAAPTGRAAQRLSEVAAIGAKTIHRLLEWSATEHCFLRDEVTPLEAQVIIIDEASMLDVHLAASLMRAIKDDAQVIFIGDVDQLPSVGPGNVLRDMIESGVVPFTKLSRIFRQAAGSHIVQMAHAINRGETPVFPEGPSDCQFLTINDPEAVKEAIKELLGKTLPEKTPFNVMRDVQVLTPMNKGPLGTGVLNEELQNLLNPVQKFGEKLETETTSFRPGDKVIQTVNNYELNVFNGDIGFIEHAGFDGGQVLVNFGDRKVTYTKDQIYDLKLAYAITIHKSQGSEFPVVIIPVSMQHFIMLQRNLIYTALTRARRLAILVGTPSALTQAVRTQTSLKRQTQLIHRLIRRLPPA
jgi:exodeoxyribonuclease V alpha subunit